MKRYENIDDALCREMDKLDKKYAADLRRMMVVLLVLEKRTIYKKESKLSGTKEDAVAEMLFLSYIDMSVVIIVRRKQIPRITADGTDAWIRQDPHRTVWVAFYLSMLWLNISFMTHSFRISLTMMDGSMPRDFAASTMTSIVVSDTSGILTSGASSSAQISSGV